MTWFEQLVGFSETTPDDVRSKLRVDGVSMTSLVNGREMTCGVLATPSLAELRERTAGLPAAGRTRLRQVVGDVGTLHADPANAGATFQAASQFNLLEMVGPQVSPSAGVSIYERDLTQGPACAIACGAATIYRNYFAPVGDVVGQCDGPQIDGLESVGRLLVPDGPQPWVMRNGYALLDRAGLEVINARLAAMSSAEMEVVRGELRVGTHTGVEVTALVSGQLVNQVFCSALPLGIYTSAPEEACEPLARLVLEATYEATLRAAMLNATATGNRSVFLTLVGGGAFGNHMSWILDAIERACREVTHADLDVAIVSYREPIAAVEELVSEINRERGGG